MRKNLKNVILLIYFVLFACVQVEEEYKEVLGEKKVSKSIKTGENVLVAIESTKRKAFEKRQNVCKWFVFVLKLFSNIQDDHFEPFKSNLSLKLTELLTLTFKSSNLSKIAGRLYTVIILTFCKNRLDSTQSRKEVFVKIADRLYTVITSTFCKNSLDSTQSRLKSFFRGRKWAVGRWMIGNAKSFWAVGRRAVQKRKIIGFLIERATFLRLKILRTFCFDSF